ncbi:unnamed protein product [Calicophoron daubneyi]|uniref:Rho-GAP domain-containing protein n=1 Tax=Calicophoron daubneyi TaxID=300641 RepID=A0AAV2T8N4_CALDB
MSFFCNIFDCFRSADRNSGYIAGTALGKSRTTQSAESLSGPVTAYVSTSSAVFLTSTITYSNPCLSVADPFEGDIQTQRTTEFSPVFGKVAPGLAKMYSGVSSSGPTVISLRSSKPQSLFSTFTKTSKRDLSPLLSRESSKPTWYSHGPIRSKTELKYAGLSSKPLQSHFSSAVEGGCPECCIPYPVLTLFVYLAQQGVHVNDLFRRPGNISQMKCILQSFTNGEPIDWTKYNVYTVANVAKKILLTVPGGLFGPSGEADLLATADLPETEDMIKVLPSETIYRAFRSLRQIKVGTRNKLLETRQQKVVTFVEDAESDPPPASLNLSSETQKQLLHLSEVAEKRINVFLRVIDSLPPSHAQLAIIIFGILHQMVFHAATTSAKVAQPSPTVTETTRFTSGANKISTTQVPLLTLAEGVVKAVAGTLFHTCSSSVLLVEQTAQVLRTLVLCFPAMGDSVTRFYLDALANRLTAPLSSAPPATNPKGCAFCVLCPKLSDHSSYFTSGCGAGSEIRHGAVSLIQAAGRLFCLFSSQDAETQSHPTTKHHSSNLRNKFGCPPFLCKVHSSPETTTHPVIVLSPSESPKTTHSAEELPASRKPPPVLSAVDPLIPDYVYDELSGQSTDHPPEEVPIEVERFNPDRPVPTLRRNQSRYRSLKRRQMENLARRAEWFLSPTTLPTVTLSVPPRKIPHDQDDMEITASANYSLHPGGLDLVTTSTVSLLELDESIRQEFLQSNTGRRRSPPRLLFTASTGELEQEDPETRTNEAPTVCRRDSGRKRLLSVGSYLSPSPAHSFVSVHSAPSAEFQRMAASDQQHLVQMENLGCYYLDYYPQIGLPSTNSETIPLNLQLPALRYPVASGDFPAHLPTVSLQGKPVFLCPNVPGRMAAVSGPDLLQSVSGNTPHPTTDDHATSSSQELVPQAPSVLIGESDRIPTRSMDRVGSCCIPLPTISTASGDSPSASHFLSPPLIYVSGEFDQGLPPVRRNSALPALQHTSAAGQCTSGKKEPSILDRL